MTDTNQDVPPAAPASTAGIPSRPSLPSASLAGPTGLGTSAAHLADHLGRARSGEPAAAAAHEPAHADKPRGDGPTGLGTSAARVADLFSRARAAEPAPTAPGTGSEPAPAEKQWDDGPTGLGTAAARLADLLTRAQAAVPATPSAGAVHDPAYTERTWGDGTASPLYVPRPERINDALAEEVDNRLCVWAKECGFSDDEITAFRKATFGRLVMLAHPDCEDPDRLLIAAKLNAAWWAADDYYADDTALGAVPEHLPPRLALAMAAMDPPPPAGEFTRPLEERLRGDRVLVALRSATEYAARYGTPAQVQRVCYSTFAMFVSWTAYAAWKHAGKYPPAWEYLAARQHDSFYTSMTLVDIVGGYELSGPIYYETHVRHLAFLAGTTCVLVNDLFSVHKDLADEKPPCNMVLQVAADRDCSIQEATEIVVKLHNDLVRDFQEGHRSLQSVPSLELQRFLNGLRGWMGGGFEWHATNPRYKSKPKQ